MLIYLTTTIAIVLFATLVLPFMGDVLRAAAGQLRDDLPTMPSLDLSWDTRIEIARLSTLLDHSWEQMLDLAALAVMHICDLPEVVMDRLSDLFDTERDEVRAPTSILATKGIVPSTCRDPWSFEDSHLPAKPVTSTTWSDRPKVEVAVRDLRILPARQARQRAFASGGFAV